MARATLQLQIRVAFGFGDALAVTSDEVRLRAAPGAINLSHLSRQMVMRQAPAMMVDLFGIKASIRSRCLHKRQPMSIPAKLFRYRLADRQ
jgi:hypothetical protein